MMKEEGEWIIVDEEKWLCLDLVVEERDEEELFLERVVKEFYECGVSSKELKEIYKEFIKR